MIVKLADDPELQDKDKYLLGPVIHFQKLGK